jgi:hypothetical protein
MSEIKALYWFWKRRRNQLFFGAGAASFNLSVGSAGNISRTNLWDRDLAEYQFGAVTTDFFASKSSGSSIITG